jgi:hypothetical protein
MAAGSWCISVARLRNRRANRTHPPDQRFEHAAIDLVQVEAAAQVAKVAEPVLRGAFLDHVLDSRLPDALDGAEPVANRLRAGHGEHVLRGVDVRRLDGEPHPVALVDQRDDLVSPVHVRREHRGHERRRGNVP